MSSSKSQINTSDRATAYAQAVVAGEIVAGPDVRAACRRHLKDLVDGPARGLYWDLEAQAHVLGYFEEVLCLNGGQYEGKPFEVLGWQAFVLGSLFGWKGSDGYRRFRVAYIETGKGSGKSPLAAGVGLYCMTSDSEPRAEIYSAAANRKQAMVLFRDAVAMVNQSPLLTDRIETSGAPGREWNLAHVESGSYFRTLSSDKARSGERPHVGLLDEIHEHRDASAVEMLRAGTKSRLQALIFMITNSGSDKVSVGWDYHQYGSQVCSGLKDDDSFFAFICGHDEGDDPFRDESCWPKSNPSLDAGLPGVKYLREQVTQARGMPSKQAAVKRINFCIWTEAASPWISGETWMDCQDDSLVGLEPYYGRDCYGGLDLSSTTDLTCLALLFMPTEDDPYWRLKPYFWLPGYDLHTKADQDRVPYLNWRDMEYLETQDGRAINKLAVLKRLTQISEYVNLLGVAYDRWRIEDLKMLAENEGISLPELKPFGQGFKEMSPALDTFEALLLDRQIRHDGNPVMTWCAANAVVTKDPAGNRKVAKDKATGRVDGIVASIMACGIASGSEYLEDISSFINDPIIV
ncbi:terminase [Advenella kashmirensis W13003]|uniref:Terminase n=1 Tax=Advenella kashmirensis W13003 TaxID=1424334 RepID=V8QMZ1_9BURK|nr:terminase TerL endonuclease subunit [Advenella kashmirensis]ETF00688.1 terminase [Advenella kashmirensis W13003]